VCNIFMQFDRIMLTFIARKRMDDACRKMTRDKKKKSCSSSVLLDDD
jgi:hypothetical protein